MSIPSKADMITALDASIAHWVKLRDDWRSSSIDGSACACCQEFDCEECPIGSYEYPRHAACEGTPYYAAKRVYYCMVAASPEKLIKLLPLWASVSQAEIDFLEKIRKIVRLTCPVSAGIVVCHEAN